MDLTNIATDKNTSPHILTQLAEKRDINVRMYVAGNPSASLEVLKS